MEDAPYPALQHHDFEPEVANLVFKHNENEAMIEVRLFQTADVPEGGPGGEEESIADEKGQSQKQDEDEEEEENIPKIFKIVLEFPEPAGLKISKKNTCHVTIVPDDDVETNEALQQQRWI